MFVQRLFGGGEAVVKMQSLDLLRDAALDVFEGEVAGCGVARLDDVEEVAVCVGVEEGEGGRLLPVGEEVDIEIEAWVAFDAGEGTVGGEVEVVFHGGEESEKVLFELEADKFFGAHVAHCSWAGGVEWIPGVGDGLREEVYPAAIGG